MMAVAGILGQELLGVQPAWWDAGAKDYGVPMTPLLAVEFLVSCDRTCNSCEPGGSQSSTHGQHLLTLGCSAAG